MKITKSAPEKNKNQKNNKQKPPPSMWRDLNIIEFTFHTQGSLAASDALCPGHLSAVI